MAYLFLVTVIWAFSFGLTKHELAGIEPSWLAMNRLAWAFLLFLPFLRWRGLASRQAVLLFGIGAVQFGLMYFFLFASYRFLAAYEVALFTAFTPILVYLLGRWAEGRLNPADLGIIGAAVAGALFVRFRGDWGNPTWTGFLLVQGANLCFALGQVAYRRYEMKNGTTRGLSLFGLLLAGGFFFSAVTWLTLGGGQFPELSWRQEGMVLYLGLVASGLGFFWWNRGAARVQGVLMLAVMNNAVIPLGVLVAWLVFRESVAWPALLGGGVLVAFSIYLSARRPLKKWR
jgi:drug/metabolite transporter (DMT)-like permease